MSLFITRKIWLVLLLLLAADLYAAYNHHAVFYVPAFLLLGFMLFFFRSPNRQVPGEPLGVIVPVDARVASIERIDSGQLAGGWRIDLISNSGGPFVVRSPMEGKICDLIWEQTPADEASATRMVIESDEGDRLQMQINPRHPRLHGHCKVHPGERIGQGSICGFVPFGGRFAVFLPESSRVLVQPGNQVRAGSDLLAKLVRS